VLRTFPAVMDRTLWGKHESGVYIFSEVEEADPYTVHVYFTNVGGCTEDIILFNVCAADTDTREQCYQLRQQAWEDGTEDSTYPSNVLIVDGLDIVSSVVQHATTLLWTHTPFFQVPLKASVNELAFT
jgi:hypothetical protein